MCRITKKHTIIAMLPLYIIVRKEPIIINTSRGAILNTLEIIAALENEQVTGCCVDVFEDEPVTKNKIHNSEVYQKLLSRKNVIATPHIAGWTVESKYKLTRILMDKIERLLNSLNATD
jgi:D-3-phosphoglycerate dehydrogenase